MQKGFAALEIVIATLIVAVFIRVAIPNFSRMIDRVALDYEVKKLYTDMRFLRSLERMTNMKDTHFSTTDDNPIILLIYPERYIFKRFYPAEIFDEHYFSYGVTASQKGGGEIWQIKFDDMGKAKNADNKSIDNDTLILTSGQGKEFYIYFINTWRFSASRVKRY